MNSASAGRTATTEDELVSMFDNLLKGGLIRTSDLVQQGHSAAATHIFSRGTTCDHRTNNNNRASSSACSSWGGGRFAQKRQLSRTGDDETENVPPFDFQPQQQPLQCQPSIAGKRTKKSKKECRDQEISDSDSDGDGDGDGTCSCARPKERQRFDDLRLEVLERMQNDRCASESQSGMTNDDADEDDEGRSEQQLRVERVGRQKMSEDDGDDDAFLWNLVVQNLGSDCHA